MDQFCRSGRDRANQLGFKPKGAGLQPGFGRDGNRKLLLLLHQQKQRIKAKKVVFFLHC